MLKNLEHTSCRGTGGHWAAYSCVKSYNSRSWPIQANMRSCKDCQKTGIGWHHKMGRRQQHKSSQSWHSIWADTGMACNPEEKKQWAFSCAGKNNGFPFLDILGYLKNTHKNPKFGKVRQEPTREFTNKFPDWDFSHSSKFGIFVGLL